MTVERSTGTGVGSGAVVPDVVDVDPELEVDGAPPPLLVAVVVDAPVAARSGGGRRVSGGEAGGGDQQEEQDRYARQMAFG